MYSDDEIERYANEMRKMWSKAKKLNLTLNFEQAYQALLMRHGISHTDELKSKIGKALSPRKARSRKLTNEQAAWAHEYDESEGN